MADSEMTGEEIVDVKPIIKSESSKCPQEQATTASTDTQDSGIITIDVECIGNLWKTDDEMTLEELLSIIAVKLKQMFGLRHDVNIVKVTQVGERPFKPRETRKIKIEGLSVNVPCDGRNPRVTFAKTEPQRPTEEVSMKFHEVTVSPPYNEDNVKGENEVSVLIVQQIVKNLRTLGFTVACLKS